MIDYNDEFWSWIQEHLNDNPANLTLKFHGKIDWADDAIMQVQCRRKTRKKLDKELAYTKFYFPTPLSAEQCSGDKLAAFHASLINKNDTVLDLTCGLGIDSLHFAEKAKSVTAIDKNPLLCDALKHNASVLGLDNLTVINEDCREFLNKTNAIYDVAFIDPARRGKDGERVYGFHDCSPDIHELLPKLQRICLKLIIKASPMLDVTQIVREMPEIYNIYITGNDTECKEIVIVIDFVNPETSEPLIHALSTSSDFIFKRSEENKTDIQYYIPPESGYIYEPNPEIMKASPLKLIAKRFGIDKISPNTHLYCSEKRVDRFPGNTLRIIKKLDYSSSNIKRFAKEFPEIRITTRNFGMTADQLRKKLKIKDGGILRLFALTTIDDKKMMIVTEEC